MRAKRTYEDYDFYNKERKFNFIKEKGNRAVIIENVYGWFEQAAFFEKKYDKDACEWTGTEIVTFMKFLSTSKSSILINMLSAFRTYTDWCMQNGLVPDHQNHYDEIKPIPFIVDCINYHELNQLVFTKEQLLEDIHDLPNACDKFVFLGLFEGLSTKQMAAARIDWFYPGYDYDEISFDGETRIKISKTLGGLITQSYEEDSYASLKTEKQSPIEQSEYIIRPLSKERTIRDTKHLIYYRFNKCISFLGVKYAMSDISTSGLIKYIYDLLKENNLTRDEFMSRPDLTSECITRYGSVSSWRLFFAIYGRYFEKLYCE